MKRKFIYTILLIASLSLLMSCDTIFVSEGKSEIIDDVTFIDDVGNKFVIEKPYENIVSLYSAHTENIYSLGAGEKLIGRGDTSIYPPQAALLPSYDYKGDPEPIVALNPDLVIIRPFINRNYPDYVSALKSAGIRVVSLYPETNDDFEKYIKILAMITGTEDKTEELFAELEERIAYVVDKTENIDEKRTVFFESTKTDYRTVTADSNPGKAIEYANGINIAGDAIPIQKGSTIAKFGIEKIMMNAENIDVYVSQRGAMNSGGSSVSIPQREGFKAIKAIQNEEILEINEKLISSPTFRYYKGVTEIARALYPEVMDDIIDFRNDDFISRENYARLLVKMNHTPIFVPSSSHYYEKEYYNHTYGLFEDVEWNDEYFDDIETAVMNSFIKGYEDEEGIEYFDKDSLVTREDLAFTLYILGDYKGMENGVEINDIEECLNREIVQKIVDNGLMDVDDKGNFNPQIEITANEAIEAIENVLED